MLSLGTMVKTRRRTVIIALVAGLLVGAVALVLFLGIGGGERLVFADDFERQDSDSLGDRWRGEGEVKIRDGEVALKDTGMVPSVLFSTQVRIEFDLTIPQQDGSRGKAQLGVAVGRRVLFGLIVSTAPAGEISIYRQPGTVFSGPDESFLPGVKRHIVFGRNLDSIRLSIDGRLVAECSNLFVSPERECLLFMESVGGEARFDNVKIYDYGDERANKQTAAADELLQQKEYARALKLYRSSLRRWGKKSVVTKVKIGQCLTGMGSYEESQKLHEEILQEQVSREVRGWALAGLLELSIHREDWAAHKALLAEMMARPEESGEWEMVRVLLDRRPLMWRSRSLWQGKRMVELIDILMAKDEMVNDSLLVTLLRLHWIANGPEGMLETTDRFLRFIDERKKAGDDWQRYQLVRAKANLLYRAGKQRLAREVWSEELARSDFRKSMYCGIGQNYTEFELQDLSSSGKAALRRRLKGGFVNREAKNWHYPVIEVIGYVWATGNRKLARKLLFDYITSTEATAWNDAMSLQYMIELEEGNPEAAIVLLESSNLMRDVTQRNDIIEVALLKKLEDPEDKRLEEQEWPGVFHWKAEGLCIPLAHKIHGEYAKCRESLEMIKGIFYPWEPSHILAGRWLKELASEHPEAFK